MVILCIEDQTLVMRMITLMMDEEGWKVECCADARLAVDRIESKRHYDLIITDVILHPAATSSLLEHAASEPNGLGIVRRARSLEHRWDTPIIVFTASECEEDAYAAGASLFLRKPEDTSRLIESIKGLAMH